MDRALKGWLAEAQFEYQATLHERVLSKPLYNLVPYDYVADIKGRLVKCQVKKSYTDKFGQQVCELRRQSPNQADKKLYREGDFDYLCVVATPEDIYIIPWQVICDKRSNITLGSKYSQYRNDWSF